MTGRYRSRKFLAALAALASAQWSLGMQLIPSADYRLIVLGTVGAYILGNIGQKAIEQRKEGAP